jgi:hypothetical protein
MGMAPLNIVDPLVGYATAAVVFTTVSQYVPSRRLELCSEIVCWAALPFLLRYTTFPNIPASSPLLNDPQKQRHSSLSQWIVALGIVAAAFYRAESNTIGFYVSSVRDTKSGETVLTDEAALDTSSPHCTDILSAKHII